MPWLEKWLIGFLAGLATFFQVTPDSLRQGRRGNQPPPEGGPASFRSGAHTQKRPARAGQAHCRHW